MVVEMITIGLDDKGIDLLDLALKHYEIDHKEVFLRGLFTLHPLFETSYKNNERLMYDEKLRKLRIVTTKDVMD